MNQVKKKLTFNKALEHESHLPLAQIIEEYRAKTYGQCLREGRGGKENPCWQISCTHHTIDLKINADGSIKLPCEEDEIGDHLKEKPFTCRLVLEGGRNTESPYKEISLEVGSSHKQSSELTINNGIKKIREGGGLNRFATRDQLKNMQAEHEGRLAERVSEIAYETTLEIAKLINIKSSTLKKAVAIKSLHTRHSTIIS